MASIVEHDDLSEPKIFVLISVPNLAKNLVAVVKAFAEPSGGCASLDFSNVKETYSSFSRKNSESKMGTFCSIREFAASEDSAESELELDGSQTIACLSFQ